MASARSGNCGGKLCASVRGRRARQPRDNGLSTAEEELRVRAHRVRVDENGWHDGRRVHSCGQHVDEHGLQR